jgi:hypothetical protein
MLKKIQNLLSSIRFWQLVAGLVLIILGYYAVIPQELANMIAGFFGISIGIGTIDKLYMPTKK